MTATPKTWSRTKHQGLYRHKSGVYYARLSLAGKKTWRSLKTRTLGVALAQMGEIRKHAEQRKEIARETQVMETMTGAEAIRLRKEGLESDPSITLREAKAALPPE